MTAKNPTIQQKSLQEFTADQQAELFDSLKQPQFSGQLIFTSSQGEKWTFYLYLGRIIYATGGVHKVRRWKRNVARYLPKISPRMALQPNLENFSICWEYELLCLWVKQQKATREQAAKMVQATVAEVLFDLTQATQIMLELKQGSSLSPELILVDAEQAIAEAKKQWHAWQAAKVAEYSPNRAPVIRQAEQLKTRISEQAYQTMSKLLNGQQTLRDTSVQMKRDVVEVTRSLLPYIQLGLVELIDIPDLPAPVSPPDQASSTTVAEPKGALIACVDDSPLICQTMEKILKEAGYQFIAVNDALRAIATLLSRKPDLIFLDLVMPNANGYEICSQLRKLSAFRNTPIVILTGNDGIVDRVKAKVVGSSDFLSKPVNKEEVLGVISKHLKQGTLT